MEYTITLTRSVRNKHIPKGYIHVFTVKCQSIADMRYAYKLLKERFAEPEFKLQVMRLRTVSAAVDLDEI